MGQDVNTSKIDIDKDKEDTEDTDSASEDDSDIDEMTDTEVVDKNKVYIENFWPVKPDKPKGFTFKGKHKLMTHAVKKSKSILKKHPQERVINNTNFTVLDNRPVGGATQVIIEISDKEGRGNGIVDFWGPNKRKECTVLIKKSKEHDERYVELVAKKVIQPILDCFVSGSDPSALFTKKKNKAASKTKTKHHCSICEKKFTSKRYMKIHLGKIHKGNIEKCTKCDYTVLDKDQLKAHILNIHNQMEEEAEISGTLGQEKDPELAESEKICFEEKRIDDTVMDTYEDKLKEPTSKRSEYRDEQIRIKERKIDEEEKEYNKRKEEKNNTRIETKKRKKSVKKKTNSMSNSNPVTLPPNIQPVPGNIKHLVKSNDFMLCVRADGACGFNSTAGHILEDPKQGPKLRRVINIHTCDRWQYYQDKYQFPYKRQIGASGEYVVFKDENELLEFLRNDERADFLWTDSQELLAIANLYQVTIKVITTKGLDDKNPITNIITPDPDMKQYALLPPGVVPDMTLIHFENNHFNLLVSSESRIFNIEISEDLNKTVEKTALEKLRELEEKYQNLQADHERCLDELNKLRKRHQQATKMSDENHEASAHIDEEMLVAMKENGFRRTGPQSQSIPRNSSTTYTCVLCKQIFKTKDTLKKHTETHNTEDEDGDWNCKNCSFQTNSESNLKNHEQTTGHKIWEETAIKVSQPSIKCNICQKEFPNENEIALHKRKDHKSFKPCRNLPNCPYGSECKFNHQPTTDKFICYDCGEEFPHLKNLMAHRKKHHTMNSCEKFLRNECPFTNEACWFNHTNPIDPTNEDIKKNDIFSKDENLSNKEYQPPVFWERPVNLAPPARMPSQASWIKMVSMMKELNQMMMNMTNQTKSQ